MRFSLLTIQREGRKCFLVHQIGEGGGFQLAVRPDGQIAAFNAVHSARAFVEQKVGTLEWTDFTVDLDEILKWARGSSQAPPSDGALKRTWFLIVLTGMTRDGFPHSIEEFIYSEQKSALVAFLSDCDDLNKTVSLTASDYQDLRKVMEDGIDYFDQSSHPA